MRIEADRFYTTAEVADFLSIKIPTLKKWRNIKKFNLKHLKAGGSIRYKGSDLLEWIAKNTKS